MISKAYLRWEIKNLILRRRYFNAKEILQITKILKTKLIMEEFLNCSNTHRIISSNQNIINIYIKRAMKDLPCILVNKE